VDLKLVVAGGQHLRRAPGQRYRTVDDNGSPPLASVVGPIMNSWSIAEERQVQPRRGRPCRAKSG
jgi:hypothetical protein